MRNNDKIKSDFIRLIDNHKGIIYKIANAYCKDHEDQQDLVQEIIIQLWKSFEKYDSKFKITTWMYRIALNISISQYRKALVRKKHTIPMEEHLANVKVEDEQDQEEEIQLLRDFIHELNPLNKAMMIMYLDGNSHEEIAKVLDISKSNVGTKINRIKEKIKNHLNQKQS